MTEIISPKPRPINTNALFSPSAIALIGGSRRPGSVGAAILKNLVIAGGPAKIIAVNPKAIVEVGVNLNGVSAFGTKMTAFGRAAAVSAIV